MSLPTNWLMGCSRRHVQCCSMSPVSAFAQLAIERVGVHIQSSNRDRNPWRVQEFAAFPVSTTPLLEESAFFRNHWRTPQWSLARVCARSASGRHRWWELQKEGNERGRSPAQRYTYRIRFDVVMSHLTLPDIREALDHGCSMRGARTADSQSLSGQEPGVEKYKDQWASQKIRQMSRARRRLLALLLSVVLVALRWCALLRAIATETYMGRARSRWPPQMKYMSQPPRTPNEGRLGGMSDGLSQSLKGVYNKDSGWQYHVVTSKCRGNQRWKKY